jgi:L-ascorbate metabolism protein UlaG (beta-lactamase superfamily)
MRRFLGTCALLLMVGAASAGEIKIAWYGQSMFLITTPKGTRVVLDPHNLEEYRVQPLKADLVLMSHFHTDHSKAEVISNIKEAKQFNALKKTGPNDAIIDWNPVDEKVKDVRFQSVGTYHDEMSGLRHGKNGVWVIDIDGVRLVHLGDLGHTLNKTQLKKLGDVDVLMVPVGGVYALNGLTAWKVVEQVKPKRVVLPMHYGTIVFSDLLPLNYFTDEAKDGGMPIVRMKAREVLTIDTAAPAPKQASVVVLDYQQPLPDLKKPKKKK